MQYSLIFQNILGDDQRQQLSNLNNSKLQKYFNSIGVSSRGQRNQLDYINATFGEGLLKGGKLDNNRIDSITKSFIAIQGSAKQAGKSVGEFVKEINNVDESLVHFIENNPNATIEDLQRSFAGIEPAAKQAAVGTQILSTAMNALVNIGIGIAISGLIALLNDLAHTQDQINQKISAVNQTWNESRTSLVGYQEQVEKYRAVLADTNSTEEQRAEARKGLIDTNSQLIEQFGDSAEAIENINSLTETNIGLITDQTGVLKDQTEAWKELSKQALNATLEESRASDNLWTKFKNWSKTYGKLGGIEDSYTVDTGMYQLENSTVRLDYSKNKLLDDYIKSMGAKGKVNGMLIPSLGYVPYKVENELSGTAFELIDQLKSIKQYAEEVGADKAYINGISAEIGKLEKQIDNFGDTWQENFKFDKDKLQAPDNAEYLKFYDSLISKQEEYNDKRIKGEDEAAETIKGEIIDTLKEAEDKAIDEGKMNMNAFFEQSFSDFDVDMNASRLADKLKATSQAAVSEESVNYLKNELKTPSMDADIGKASQDNISNYLVKEIMTALSTSEEELGDNFADFKQSVVSSFNSGWAKGLNNEAIINEVVNNTEEILQSAQERIDSYNGKADYRSIVDKLNSSGLSVDRLNQLNNIYKYQPELYKKEGTLESIGFSEEDVSLFEEILILQAQYEQSWDNVIAAIQQSGASLVNFKDLYDSTHATDLGNGAETFNTVISGMSNKYQSSVGNWGREEWDSFDSYYDQLKAKNIETEDAIRSAIVHVVYALQQQKEVIAETVQEAIDYSKELEELGIDQQYFDDYVENLQKIREEYKYNKEEAQKFALEQLKVNEAVKDLGGGSDENGRALSGNLENYIDNLNNAINTSTEYSDAINSLTKDLSNLTSMDFSQLNPDELKEFVNTNLKDLTDSLAGDADAFDRFKASAITALAETSNQVTALKQTMSDLEFNQLMIDVGCNLDTEMFNEQFDQMVNWIAQASLGDIDAVANLNTNPFAQAIQEILKQGGEAAKKLEAIFESVGVDVEIEMQTINPRAEIATVTNGMDYGHGKNDKTMSTSVSMEVPKSIRFKPRGTNLDTTIPKSSGTGKSGGGGGGGGGSKDHTPTEHTPKEDAMDKAADSMTDAANAAKEAFEKEKEEAEKELDIHYIDWIERLLDKLATTVKKWTDAAEDFFTFWNKNMALNRAIMASHEELVAQQNAAKIYENHAKTAAQKAGRSLKVDEEELTFEVVDDDPLSQAYINKIKMGAMQIETLNGKQTALQKKIEEYITWYITCHFIW